MFVLGGLDRRVQSRLRWPSICPMMVNVWIVPRRVRMTAEPSSSICRSSVRSFCSRFHTSSSLRLFEGRLPRTETDYPTGADRPERCTQKRACPSTPAFINLRCYFASYMGPFHALIGHVAVQLTHRLKGSVHGQHRHTGIDGVNVPVCHEAGHSAAAAGVHLAQLRHLPDHTPAASSVRRT